MKHIALLLLIPLVAVAGIAALFVGVLGFALPFLAEHGIPVLAPQGLPFVMAPWFQGLIKFVLLLLVMIMPFASLLTWAERRESAMMQDRLGPNRADILGFKAWGIFHFVADAAKMMFKEDFVPAKANRFLFSLAPFLAIVPVFIIFTIMPFGPDICVGHLMDVVSDAATCPDRVSMWACSSTSPSRRSRCTAPRSPAGRRTTNGRCSAACAPPRR